MSAHSLASRLPLVSATRFAALRAPAFRNFCLSGLLDDMAGWLLFAAQGWLLINLTHQPQTVVLFFIVRVTPKALVALPAGALCDRIGPLPILRVARVAGALPAIVILLGALAGWLTVDLLLTSALCTSLVQAFERPAQRSLLHAYAPCERLVSGVALCSMASTAAALTSPLLFVVVAAFGGALWVLPFQALLAVIAGALLFRNHAPARAQTATVGASIGKECLTGLRYLVATPTIVALLVLVSSPATLDRLLTFVTPEYADGSGSAGMMLLFLAPATGALIGGSLLAWVGGELRRLLPLALGSSSVAVVSVSLLATTRLFLLSLLLFLLLGAAKAAFSVTVMSALQRRVPDHVRGRLLAL
jgi:MFS family permease